MVDGLHLPHLDEPHAHRLGGGLENSLPVVLRLVQHLWTQRRGGHCMGEELWRKMMQTSRDF